MYLLAKNLLLNRRIVVFYIQGFSLSRFYFIEYILYKIRYLENFFFFRRKKQISCVNQSVYFLWFKKVVENCITLLLIHTVQW